jgi:hypothetical protein
MNLYNHELIALESRLYTYITQCSVKELKLSLLQLQLEGFQIDDRPKLHSLASRIIHYNQEPITIITSEYAL